MASNTYPIIQDGATLTFIRSTDVKVFPCSYRGYFYDSSPDAPDTSKIFDPEARSFTEHNYSNIYSKLGDSKESFVISWNASKGVLKCVIDGYYIELQNMATSDFANNKKLIIRLDDIDLGSIIDGQRYKTAILNTLYNDTINYLDTKLEDNNFYFVGLAIVDADYPEDRYTASLAPFKTVDGSTFIDWDKRRVTDSIDTGTGTSSVRMLGDVAGAEADACTADGNYSTAFGRKTNASGFASVAFGENAHATADRAIAVGNNTTSSYENAIATGDNTKTSTANQLVIGKYNDDDADALLIIANDGDSTHRANNVTIHKNGDIWTTGSLQVDGGRIKAVTKNTNILQLGSTGENNSGKIEVYGTGDDQVFTVANTGETYIEEKTKINNYVEIKNKTYNTSAIKPGLTVQGQIKAEKGLNNTLTLGSSTSGDYGAINVYGESDKTVFTVTKAGAINAASTLTVKGATTLNNTLTVADGKATTLGGTLTTKGDTTLQSKLDVTGATKLSSTLETTGATTLKSTLGVTGNTTIGGTITVTGASTLNNSLTVGGASTFNNTLTVASGKATSLGGTLTIAGTTTLNDAVTVKDDKKTTLGGQLEVKKSANFKDAITAESTVNVIGDLTASANASVSGTLTATGATTLSDSLSVSKSATIGETLSVTGGTTLSSLSVTTITGSGNWSTSGTMTAASYNASSDKRLKENIKEFKLEKSILDLPIYKYDFINGPKNQIGCLAQDLQEICPELVHKDENEFLSIQESKLVYLLLEEVKKLKEEIKKIKEN